MRHLLILALASSVQGPDYDQPAPECGLGYDLGALTRVDNKDGTKKFRQAGVETDCVKAPPHPVAGCTFCFSFQLTRQYRANIWEVVKPYPVAMEIPVECEKDVTRTLTTTTPVLGPGTYEMTAVLFGGPCDITPSGLPTEVRKDKFTVK